MKRASSTLTKHIALNPHRCKACWQCQHVCPHRVLTKINILWHKHARIVNAQLCVGCFKCVKVCQSQAITQIDRPHHRRGDVS
ncbi:4Fe-4S dicluster domain-containing protein [Breznakibacter xylanolyticus]|uniref:4Fe-4S dicluster domain-containing protein n=1 Tax=Breznakibacter xylanolyticus TaxID=990 RepID=UPI000DAD4A41